VEELTVCRTQAQVGHPAIVADAAAGPRIGHDGRVTGICTSATLQPGNGASTDPQHSILEKPVADLLLLTSSRAASAEVLPALSLLGHVVRVAPLEVTAMLDTAPVAAVLVDARRDLLAAKALCRLLRATGPGAPLLAVLTEGGLAALSAEWGVDDVLLDTAGPAEVDTRLRLAVGRLAAAAGVQGDPGVVRAGELTIDEGTYTCRLRGRPLDLTFKEFELLKHLAQHPGRVFTRAQLLQEVWGYDYYGGTRTVDVHVRRLRAKLGTEHEQLIGTVRHVGYKFVTPPLVALADEQITLPEHSLR